MLFSYILQQQEIIENGEDTVSSWSGLKPILNLDKDDMGNLQEVTIKFDTAAITDADRAKLKFLEDILMTIVN